MRIKVLESKHESAIRRMIAVLEVLRKGNEHRPDIIKQVIKVGEHALKDDNGQ